MNQLMLLEGTLNTELGLTRRPVAISFLEAPPAGLEKFNGVEPSGCSFWRLAGNGRRFYTVPSDHFNCPIGSHTHAIALPNQRQNELADTLSFMSDIGYIRMEEVDKIPTLAREPKIISYAPLGDAVTAPDVVILVGKPGSIMLLVEAAARAGVTTQFPVFGRPTCMTVPAALQAGVVGSSGCIGNRVYTDISDDELYVTVRGADLAKVVGELETIISANDDLREYHRTRKKALTKE